MYGQIELAMNFTDLICSATMDCKIDRIVFFGNYHGKPGFVRLHHG